jgi:hypothetical protein
VLIYIAGPYSAPTDEGKLANVKRALEVGQQVWKLGHYPLIPHLTHYLDLHIEHMEGDRRPCGDYYELDNEYLSRCDAIFRYCNSNSPSADAEWELAGRLGLARYKSFDEIPQGPGPHGKREAFLRIFQERVAVAKKRNRGYGNRNIDATGEIGIGVRVIDKGSRIMELAINSYIIDEDSLDDALLDTANYGDIGQLLRRGWWGLPW